MKALIFGLTGMCGSHLAELLLGKGYEVAGFVRRTSTNNRWRLKEVEKDIHFYHGDLVEPLSIYNAVKDFQPDEVYNLAAQSFVKDSFDAPAFCGAVTALGCLNVLEAIKKAGKDVKFYQASSSEMFGKVQETPQDENTPFYPRSPYGVAKVYAHWITQNYREAYGMFNCIGINFNNESPRRGEEFVSRKITKAVAMIKAGKQKELVLGDLKPKRDWGYSPEYMEVAWKMMQQPEPDTYVIGTGKEYSVEEFLVEAFSIVGLNWKDYVIQDDKYRRPSEVNLLVADPTKAREKLDWRANVDYKQLVYRMVMADIERINNGGS